MTYIPEREEHEGLDDLLERWTVYEPGSWDNDMNNSIISTWAAVANDEGIIAYFGDIKDALRFRLAEINRILNG